MLWTFIYSCWCCKDKAISACQTDNNSMQKLMHSNFHSLFVLLYIICFKSVLRILLKGIIENIWSLFCNIYSISNGKYISVKDFLYTLKWVTNVILMYTNTAKNWNDQIIIWCHQIPNRGFKIYFIALSYFIRCILILCGAISHLYALGFV